MLILARKMDEGIMIGDDVRMHIVSVHGGTVRIGIEAPKEIDVHRDEVYARVQSGKGDTFPEAAQ